MIRRDYLPYASAVNYVDRGLVKWMGFFLSEHTGEIHRHDRGYPESSWEFHQRKWELLLYAHFQQVPIQLFLQDPLTPHTGKVIAIGKDRILFRERESEKWIEEERIRDLSLFPVENL